PEVTAGDRRAGVADEIAGPELVPVLQHVAQDETVGVVTEEGLVARARRPGARFEGRRRVALDVAAEPAPAERGAHHERVRPEPVRDDEARGQRTPGVQPPDDADAEAQRRRRQAEERLYLAVDRRLAPRASLGERGPDAVDHGVEVLGGLEADLRREERRVALHALLGAERQPDAAPVVDTAAGDEAVEPRELRQRFADGAQHEV